MRLAELSTVRTERAIRSRISDSRLNALMMRAPSTVSLIVCMIWVEPWNERLAKRRTLSMILRMKKMRIGSAQTRADGDERVLVDHHRPQTDDGEEIAGAALDDELQRVAHAVGGDHQPGDEFTRMAVLEEHQVLIEQAVEHASLRGRDDAIADARQGQRRAEGGGAAQHEQRHHLERHRPHLAEFFGRDHAVEHRLEHRRDAGVGERDQGEQQRAQRVAAHVVAAEIAEQPSEQTESADVFVRVRPVEHAALLALPERTERERRIRPCAGAPSPAHG